MEAIALLNQKASVNNFTWNQEIAERNQRIARDLTKGLIDLKVSFNQKATPASGRSDSKPAQINSSSVIQDNIDNLSGLLDEAVLAKMMKASVNNSTNQALALGNTINEIFYIYAQALGFPEAKLANMVATTNMSAVSSNMNMQGKSMRQILAKTNASSNRNMPAMGNKMNNILNESDYENAQAYVKQAQEIFAKYLKSLEAANKNASSDIQPHLNTILSHLKRLLIAKVHFVM
ncbi:MAG: hypothetical protein WBP64_09950 [Nitrososphaeraceae archaeon]